MKMNIIKGIAVVTCSLSLSFILWGLSGYELGNELGMGTKITQFFSNGLGRLFIGSALVTVALRYRWIAVAVGSVAFLLFIGLNQVRNECFRMGANIRLNMLLNGNYKVESISKMNHYSPWKVDLIGPKGDLKSQDILVGSGRGSPWCILVTDRYKLNTLHLPPNDNDKEWYEVEAMTRLSGRNLNFIAKPGVQFAWTFDVTVPD